MFKETVLGKNLQNLREKRDLTQPELAERAEVSSIAVTQIETGRREDPRVSTVAKIAKALNVPMEEIVYGSDVERGAIPDFSVSIDFLSRFAGLPPVFQRMALVLIYQDRRFVEGLSLPPEMGAEIQRLLGPLLKAKP